MSNLFDGIQDTAGFIVVNTMGYVATWTPSNGSQAQTGKVLFNRPTQKEEITDEDYGAVSTKCEYQEGLLSGLFELVQKGSSEPISIAGMDYYAYKADRKFDGKTIILQLEPRR